MSMSNPVLDVSMVLKNRSPSETSRTPSLNRMSQGSGRSCCCCFFFAAADVVVVVCGGGGGGGGGDDDDWLS